jgi:hypothetical protein
MNRIQTILIRMGMAGCLFGTFLLTLYAMSWSILLWAICLPGLFVWWTLCVYTAWRVECWLEDRLLGDE